MLKKLGNKLKQDQKGMTLIELLAVIVILGIIAAIAIPSIMGIIGNTKKDAHIANAKQMVAAARNGIANGAFDAPTDSTTDKNILLKDLVDEQFMELPDDPTDSDGYDTTLTFVTVHLNADNSLSYSVTLEGDTEGQHVNNVPITTLERDNVTP